MAIKTLYGVLRVLKPTTFLFDNGVQTTFRVHMTSDVPHREYYEKDLRESDPVKLGLNGELLLSSIPSQGTVYERELHLSVKQSEAGTHHLQVLEGRRLMVVNVLVEADVQFRYLVLFLATGIRD